MYRVSPPPPKKNGTILLYALTLSNIYPFSKLFYHQNWEKFAIIPSLKIPPHLKCVATLHCEMSLSVEKLLQRFTDHAIGQWRRWLECVVQQQCGHIEHLM